MTALAFAPWNGGGNPSKPSGARSSCGAAVHLRHLVRLPDARPGVPGGDSASAELRIWGAGRPSPHCGPARHPQVPLRCKVAACISERQSRVLLCHSQQSVCSVLNRAGSHHSNNNLLLSGLWPGAPVCVGSYLCCRAPAAIMPPTRAERGYIHDVKGRGRARDGADRAVPGHTRQHSGGARAGQCLQVGRAWVKDAT